MINPLDIHSRRILIVDDIEDNIDLVVMLLEDQGYTNLDTAANGREALHKLEKHPETDLVLLDIFMPDINGYEVLERIKASPRTADIPVIMISAHDKLESVIRCIEGGALDYITKPVEETFLIARVRSTLERKFLQDQQKALYAQIDLEKQKSERLLYQVLPKSVADRLRKGEPRIADAIDPITVVFTDLVGFTALSSTVNPDKLVNLLNDLFGIFDEISARYGLEKIKTIGDAYMAVGGLAPHTDHHAFRAMEFALEALEWIENYNSDNIIKLHLRVGLHSGSAVAGVIGHTRFTYDLWGNTVNIASRMEELCEPDQIQVSIDTYQFVKDCYQFEPRGEVAVKGFGPLYAFLTSPARAGRLPARTALRQQLFGHP